MIPTRQTAFVTLLTLAIGAGLGSAQVNTDWYYISFNNLGKISHETIHHPQSFGPISTSGGDGDGWYYYPASDRYIMWFYNGPFSTNHITEFDMWAFIAAVDFTRVMDYDISMGWTTPAWTDPTSPPRPSDMPSLGDESTFIVENRFDSGSHIILEDGTIESSHNFTSRSYNPTWVFVSASGRNMMAFRWLDHTTLPKSGDDSGSGGFGSIPIFTGPPPGSGGGDTNGNTSNTGGNTGSNSGTNTGGNAGGNIPASNAPPVVIPQVPTKSPSAKYVTGFGQPVDIIDGPIPQVVGWGLPSDNTLGPVFVDDWSQGGSQPVQGIRWWGFFDNWTQPTPPNGTPISFHFDIWTNNPATGLPASVVWETSVSCWTWSHSGQLLDARGGAGGESVFEFTSLFSQNDWFNPTTGAGSKYWIGISAVNSSGQQGNTSFNWMTRKRRGSLAAVEVQQVGGAFPGQVAQWPPSLGETFQLGVSVQFPAGVSWDTAFELITSGGVGFAPGGDLNGDGAVDVKDLSTIMGIWLD